MKKFYTDVMQDLASPDSTAPVKVPATELPLDSYADTKTDEEKKSGNKEDTKKIGNLFTNDLKVINQEDGDLVSSLVEDTTLIRKKIPRKDGFQKTNSPNQVSENQVSGCMKVPEKVCCQKTNSLNQVWDDQDGASLVLKMIHENATPEHMALASSQVSVEVEGWEWDSVEEEKEGKEEKEISSCKGIDIDKSTTKGPISTDVLSLRTVGEGLAQASIGNYLR